MKAALVVCVLVATAAGAPRYKRTARLDARAATEVRAAEDAWTAAEKDPDRAASWEAAAAAFAAVEGAAVDSSVKREAAYAEVLAWRNVFAIEDASQTFDVRAQKFVAAIDRYVKYADASDPQLPILLFLKARAYPVEQLALAIPIYRTIVTRYPRHGVAEHAASFLLDAYNQRRDYDQLLAFANELANDRDFLRDRDDLAATVKKIQAQGVSRRAEALERIAHESHDPELYMPVATAYLDIYYANPNAPDGDEALYNAGVSFENAHSIASATRTFELLRKQYPKSKLVVRTTARLGVLYGNIAMYDRAAELLEEYAKKYAGEKDTYDALSDAIYYRKATGNRTKAIDDTRYFIKLFGAKRARESADAMWSLTALYEGDAAITHLREYVRAFGAKGGAGRLVIAHAKIGQLLLQQSCTTRGVDGLCMNLQERARTCGKGMTTTFAVTARDQRKSADARAELEQAIREYERNPPADDVEARYFYAQALLASADRELEEFLALAFPRGLDFDDSHRADSTKRFATWFDQKQKSGAALTRKYEAVLATKDVASSITAAARLAIISKSFATSIATAEIPRDVKTGPRAAEQQKAYCERMLEVAEPLEERAISGYGVCLAKSTELGWFSDSSALCERELARMKPDEFPLAHELRGTPTDYAPVIAAEPPLR